MANTQIDIAVNGTTTLATAGKYCDRNIDVNVAVPASGITPTGTKNITTNGTHDVANYASANVNVPTAQPTQFINLYDVANVTIDKNSGTSGSAGYVVNTDSESNILRISYHHIANTPFVLRLRGISTIRSRLGITAFAQNGETVVAYGQFNGFFDLTYDEFGDTTLTAKGAFLTKEYYYFEFNFQYPSFSSATEALTGPIITINEPIGNGGYVE